jgi:hypothetical protein
VVILAGAQSPAEAREIDEAHTAILSAERLTSAQYSTESAGGTTNSFTDVYLFSGALATRTPFNVPRLALDYTAARHFTIGGALTYAHLDRSGSSSSDTLMIASPRLGVMLPLSPRTAFWGRGGVTYYSGDSDLSGLGVDVEALLVVKLIDNFGATFSALADVGVQDSRGDDYRNYGAAAGIAGWF